MTVTTTVAGSNMSGTFAAFNCSEFSSGSMALTKQ